jgi:hypothetical protein
LTQINFAACADITIRPRQTDTRRKAVWALLAAAMIVMLPNMASSKVVVAVSHHRVMVVHTTRLRWIALAAPLGSPEATTT